MATPTRLKLHDSVVIGMKNSATSRQRQCGIHGRSIKLKIRCAKLGRLRGIPIERLWCAYELALRYGKILVVSTSSNTATPAR